MEPTAEIVTELRRREPVFHQLPEGTTREELEPRLTADFFEIGASGRVYSRERVIETVVDRYERNEPSVDNEVDDFKCVQLAEHIFLVTYDLRQPDGHAMRLTRRATVWTNELGRWQVAYHQGTLADAGAPA